MKPQAAEFLLFLTPLLAVGHKHNVRNYPLYGALSGCHTVGLILSYKDIKFSLLVQNELFVSIVRQLLVGQNLITVEASRSHSVDTHHTR
jgi:hypothetical protein